MFCCCSWLAVKVVSSAKRNISKKLQTEGKSFFYIRKKNGPKIEPCQTPQKISLFADVELFFSLYWVQFDKQFLKQSLQTPLTP